MYYHHIIKPGIIHKLIAITVGYLVFAALPSKAANSGTGCVDGIYYFYYNNDRAWVAAPPTGVEYKGILDIPAKVSFDKYNTCTVVGYQQDAFVGQDKLVSLSCPASGTTPAPSHFIGCDALESVKFTNLDKYSQFEGCVYKQEYNSSTKKYHKSLLVCPPNRTEFIAAPSSSIMPSAFTEPSRVEKITLSTGTSIGNGWGNFISLKGFDASNSNAFKDIDGVLYSKTGGTLVAMPGLARDSYSISQEADTISLNAFADCHIADLYLGDKKYNINPFAFTNFHGNLTISGNVNLRTIPNVVFIGGVKYFNGFDGTLTLLGEITPTMARSLGDLDENATIRCEGAYIDLVRKYWKGNIESTTTAWIIDRTPGYTDVSFSINMASDKENAQITVVYDGQTIKPEDGRYHISGLVPDSSFPVILQIADTDGSSTSITDFVETKAVRGLYSVMPTSSQQTSITYDLEILPELLDLGLEGGVQIDNTSPNPPVICLTSLTTQNVNYYNQSGYAIIKIAAHRLTPGATHTSLPILVNGNDTVAYDDYSYHMSTRDLKLTPVYKNRTQRSITLSGVTNSGDFNVSDWKVSVVNDDNTTTEINGYTVSNLFEDSEYYASLLFEKDNVQFMKGVILSTLPLNLRLKTLNVGPTSASFETLYNEGDAAECITKLTIKCNGKDIEGTEIIGLTPQTKYSATVVATLVYEDGNNKTTRTRQASVDFTTANILLQTEKPRNVNPTTTILAATTNISDAETGAGFEWKKNDAPASLEPSAAYGIVYGGRLEGAIVNLQSDHYYDFRAFYADATGKKTYTEWKTFDPSDFSYFDPVVHTRAVSDITSRSALLSGIMMPGTDIIEFQGFEIYIADNRATDNARIQVKASLPLVLHETIFTQGLNFTASTNNLQPNTQYIFRSFVKTSKSYYYGEEKTFTTTEDSSALLNVTIDDEPIIIGYYDLTGRPIVNPSNGIYIAVYSNGTSRKIRISD